MVLKMIFPSGESLEGTLITIYLPREVHLWMRSMTLSTRFALLSRFILVLISTILIQSERGKLVEIAEFLKQTRRLNYD